jgi:hypothetical protein
VRERERGGSDRQADRQTLRDKCNLRVFQNRVLRMIAASKRKAAFSQFTLHT